MFAIIDNKTKHPRAGNTATTLERMVLRVSGGSQPLPPAVFPHTQVFLNMALDFRPAPSKRGDRSRPGMYRGTQNDHRRVLLLAGLLLLVLLMMNEAQKAENFHWLWYLQGQPIPDEQGARVDTRMRESGLSSDPDSEFGPLVTGIRADQQPSPTPSLPALPDAPEPFSDSARLAQARTDAWSGLMQAMDLDMRQRFLRGLKAARDGQPADPATRQAWPDLVQWLDEGWNHYLQQARQSLDDEEIALTEDERSQWRDILDHMQQQWQERSLSALKHLAESPPSTTEHQTEIQSIQAELDTVFLAEVRDNTVFRAAETDAWFRLFERLASNDVGDPSRMGAPLVSFGQLFKQPDVYRGRLVTVQGAARRAEFMEAPANIYGIANYFRLWLQPSGSNSPIVIYSLEIPEHFPAAGIAGAPGSIVDMDEPVEITGFFFKRWPYPAQDGTRLAPVLLSRTVSWSPGSIGVADPERLPGWTFWLGLIAGTALFGAGVATLAHWFSGRSTPRALRQRIASRAKQGGGS